MCREDKKCQTLIKITNTDGHGQSRQTLARLAHINPCQVAENAYAYALSHPKRCRGRLVLCRVNNRGEPSAIQVDALYLHAIHPCSACAMGTCMPDMAVHETRHVRICRNSDSCHGWFISPSISCDASLDL